MKVYPEITVDTYIDKVNSCYVQRTTAASDVRILGDDGKWYLVLHRESYEFPLEGFDIDYQKEQMVIQRLHASAYRSSIMYVQPEKMLNNLCIELDKDQRSELQRFKDMMIK